MTSPAWTAPSDPSGAPSDSREPRARAERARMRAGIGLVVAVATAALLTWAVATGGSVVAGVDRAVTDVTRAWADRLGWPVEVAHVIGEATAPVRSALAGFVFFVILMALRQRAAAGWIALSGIAGVLASEAVKHAVGRERPPGAEHYEPDLFKSFPSGHAMVGIYLYLVAGLVLVHLGRAHGRRPVVGLGWALVVIGPLIGLTRLVLGVHWPTDLIAGWAFGSTVALTSALLLWWPLDRGWAGRRSPGATGPSPASDSAESGEPSHLAPDQLP